MALSGPHNSLTDIAGLRVGHCTDTAAASGVTVVLCPPGTVGGVDVRGSAPGTRETDLLDPVNLVEHVQAVALCGGSVFGLAAADGVVRWLAERGRGFPLGGGHVAPIVPAAALFDLGMGDSFVPPVDASWGRRACEAAAEGPVAVGSVGAGTGATAAGLKGGVGTASLVLETGIAMAALAAVNAHGSAIDPANGRPWEIGCEQGGEFGRQGRRAVETRPVPEGRPGNNTTIAVVATDAALTKSQATKVAAMAHDGLARAVRPAHTMFDGDTVFCLATGQRPLPDGEGVFDVPAARAVTDLGAAAADCLARSVVCGVLAARALGGVRAFRDLPDRS